MRIAGFLCRGGDGIKPEVRKKDDSRSPDDSGQSEFPEFARIGGNERSLVGRIHKRDSHSDDSKNDRDLHNYDDSVENCRFTNSLDQ
jgi:hypothetical protein